MAKWERAGCDSGPQVDLVSDLVSIVIVTHRRRRLLFRCLESCLRQDYPHIEIVVLLNPADPEAEMVIREKMPQVKIIRSHRNLGAFPAKNLAIANSDGDYIMIVDDDAYFLSTDVISRLRRAYEVEPELGAVTCNIEGPRERTISGEDRYIHVFKDGFTMMPRQVYTEWVGYYPDLFFRSAGEMYLCAALWNLGRRVKCLVEARMFHDLAEEGRSDQDWKFYGIRSQALCVVLREPWFIAPFSLASKFLKSFINHLRWRRLLTWFKAWWSFATHLPEVLPDRRPVTWRTYKLLRRLQNSVITRPEDLGEMEPLRAEEGAVFESGQREMAASTFDKPLASVVIPTCNRVEELRKLLQSALAQTVPVEIHVMDDGSNDLTVEMILREFPSVHYHRLSTGRGPTFQRNRGIELASCNIVFPVDDDSLFASPNTVEQTLAEFDHPRVGAVGIPYINVRQDQSIRQRAPKEGQIYVTWAFVGAAHAVRRDVFLNVGGYREHFFYMGEEGDLCLRMMNSGYLTRLGTADPIHHLESPSRNPGRAGFSGRRNDVRFVWHNVPAPDFPLHLAGTTFNAVLSAVGSGCFWRMLYGTALGYADFFRLWNERRPVPRKVYQLHRTLKKRGPQLLEEIEQVLPPLNDAIRDSEYAEKVLA
jgi:GT2 family glycosyltransferase